MRPYLCVCVCILGIQISDFYLQANSTSAMVHVLPLISSTGDAAESFIDIPWHAIYVYLDVDELQSIAVMKHKIYAMHTHIFGLLARRHALSRNRTFSSPTGRLGADPGQIFDGIAWVAFNRSAKTYTATPNSAINSATVLAPVALCKGSGRGARAHKVCRKKNSARRFAFEFPKNLHLNGFVKPTKSGSVKRAHQHAHQNR